MEKLRVITLSTGEKIKGLEGDFITSHNNNHGTAIIIHREKFAESIIYPRFIIMDTLIDQGEQRKEDEKLIKALAKKEEKYKVGNYKGSFTFDLPKKQKPKTKSIEQLEKKYGIKPNLKKTPKSENKFWIKQHNKLKSKLGKPKKAKRGRPKKKK